MSTPYHARYFAYELTRQGSAGKSDRLSQALFALRSPITKGIILADVSVEDV